MTAPTAARPSVVGDSVQLAGRHLRLMSRRPSSVIGGLVLPVLFAVMFLTVFGRVMQRAGIDYVQYLIPAITLQAVFFAAQSGSIWAAEDASSGMVPRLRAMPIARSAPVLSLLIGETVRAVLGAAVLVIVGYLAGFRFEAGFAGAVVFFVLVVACAAAICLPYLVLGYYFADVETTQAIGGTIFFPLLLVSTLFVPATAYPGWLRPIVENQPLSRMGDALRAVSTAGVPDTAWKVLIALLWCAGLTVVFGFLAPRAFGRIR